MSQQLNLKSGVQQPTETISNVEGVPTMSVIQQNAKNMMKQHALQKMNGAGGSLKTPMPVSPYPWCQSNPMMVKQQSMNLEQALLKSIEMMSAQSAYFAPIAQTAMNINLMMIKLHEESREERKRIEEGHRAERQKADERHYEHISHFVDQFTKVVSSLQNHHGPAIGSLSHEGASHIINETSSETSEQPKSKTQSPASSLKRPSSSSNPKSSKSPPAKKLSLDRSRIAKKTGIAVSPGCISENSEKNMENKRPRKSVFIGQVMIGKGTGYNEALKKFSSYRCLSCPIGFSTEKKLIEHCESVHKDVLKNNQTKRIRSSKE